MNPLEYSIDSSAITDGLRCLASFMAGMVVVWGILRITFWRIDPIPVYARFMHIGMFSFAFITGIYQIQQIGSPVVVWRFSLVIFGTLCYIIGMILSIPKKK